MSAIATALHEEIDRLVSQRDQQVAELAETDRQLSAAAQYLGTLEPGTKLPEIAPVSPAPPAPPWRPRKQVNRLPPEEGYPTIEDVEAITLPPTIGGRRVSPNSKKGRAIKGIIVYLRDYRPYATRDALLEFLKQMKILGREEKPEAALSVILSEAGELFDSDRYWYLLEQEDEM